MDLDPRQTRSLFLAGTVALPRPFPSLGTISFDDGQLTYAVGENPQNKELLILQERHHNRTVVRLMMLEDVSAVFIAGEWDTRGAFQISDKPYAEDLEQGEWFVDTDVNIATVRNRLNLQQQVETASRNSILRGIVFIAKDRGTLRITEVSQTAGAEDEDEDGYPCCCCPTWKTCC
jgi:hypothetical protein